MLIKNQNAPLPPMTSIQKSGILRSLRALSGLISIILPRIFLLFLLFCSLLVLLISRKNFHYRDRIKYLYFRWTTYCAFAPKWMSCPLLIHCFETPWGEWVTLTVQFFGWYYSGWNSRGKQEILLREIRGWKNQGMKNQGWKFRRYVTQPEENEWLWQFSSLAGTTDRLV